MAGSPNGAPPERGKPPTRSRLVVEMAVAWAISVIATVVFYQLSNSSGFFRDYLHTLVGAVFVAIPLLILLPRRESFDGYGLPPQALWPELLFALVAALIVFPPFWVGFRVYWGWERAFHLEIPPEFWGSALANLVVVAVPEELFYRGYLLNRLNLVTGRRVRILGADVGLALPLSAAMFALGHFVVTFEPERLAVFFPALLFGWVAARRGSITAAAVFHALCNIFMDILLLAYGIIDAREYYQ